MSTLARMTTRLLIPFTWTGDDADRVAAAWCDREVRNRVAPARRIALWKRGSAVATHRHKDLEPSVVSLLDLDGGASLRGRWDVVRCHMTPEAVKQVFERVVAKPEGAAKDWQPPPERPLTVERSDGTSVGPFTVQHVEGLLLPKGDGILSIVVEWLCDSRQEVEHAIALHAASVRLMPRPDGGAWKFGNPDMVSLDTMSDGRRSAWEQHGAAVDQSWAGLTAVRLGARCGVGELARWLLEPRTDAVAVQLDTGLDARPVSSIVLNGPPPSGTLEQVLFRLGRAFDLDHGHLDVPSEADITLAMRTNRFVAMSREAAACISWADGTNDEFERGTFPDHFVRQYAEVLLLSLVESRGLSRLTSEVAEGVGLARSPDGTSWNEKAARDARDALRRLGGDLVHYVAVMSWEDAGGLSDYVRLHQAQRRLWRLSERRNELRDKVQGLLALAEAAHGDVLDRDREARADQHALEAKRDASFQRAVAWLGTIGVPFGVVTGLLGMDVELVGPALQQLSGDTSLVVTPLQLVVGATLLSGVIAVPVAVALWAVLSRRGRVESVDPAG